MFMGGAYDQESLASLSLLGGWLEAMYIGTRIFQEQEILDMSDRILQQKYTLISLMGLLGNYQESLVVRRYMHPLTSSGSLTTVSMIRMEMARAS